MYAGSNPTDKIKHGTKRHILTDKKWIPISIVIISAANKHDIKAVTDVINKYNYQTDQFIIFPGRQGKKAISAFMSW